MDAVNVEERACVQVLNVAGDLPRDPGIGGSVGNEHLHGHGLDLHA
jgi:hypothetical protein